jgi:adenosylcobinamide-GDP ribazoletransferase
MRPAGRRGLNAATSFLTPVGGAVAPSPRALVWFPVVGALIGTLVGGVWSFGARVWPLALAAALALAADLALTGMLHLDGLVDSADGLLAPMERERRLTVMADSGAGAFGVAAAIAVLLVRFGALAGRLPSVWLVAGLWCASRTVMAVALGRLPYARPGGLAESWRGGTVVLPALAGGALAVVLAVAGMGWPGVVAVAGVVAGGGAVLALGVRRIGGYTGDVLGAAGVVGETVGLVVAAARW